MPHCWNSHVAAHFNINFSFDSHLSVTGVAPGWASGVEDHFVAQAKYDFTGQGNDELTFKAGQNIHVAPKGKIKSD